MKYKKKPVVIEAFRYGFDPIPEWCDTRKVSLVSEGEMDYLEIHTLEGDMIATSGDYVIKGVEGEIYPCKAHIFEQTYEQVIE